MEPISIAGDDGGSRSMVQVLTTQELRDAYIQFFTDKGATHYPSASLVPENDPTILFTVAGMAQFKDMFLGRGTHDFTRAVTCQKVIRTNDIMEVGRTPRHHTFFEMLGNFSFNDYFKREAIHWAWEFLTKVLELPKERLSVSVHTIDDEAYDIWAKEIGIPAERIFRMGDSDNFWPASAPADGPMGPGGCCSEIFWDFQNNDVENDNLTTGSDRFVEVWNLVFPQFNVCEPKVDGRYTLEDLGRQNIDTGMGLERIACVIQGKTNNFDTDEFQQIIQAVVDVVGDGDNSDIVYVEDAQSDADKATNTLLRRVCDHVRAVTFCITDNARPSNVGRGYVVRRLIRRATLDIDKLGVHETALYKIVQAVVAVMGAAYPDLRKRQELCEQTLEAEESGFRKTLRKGLDMLQKCLSQHVDAGKTVFSGDDAFELVTTHGFPRELIEELIAVEKLAIDDQQYDIRWQKFVAISRSKSLDVFTSTALQEAKPRLGATSFVGYDCLEVATTITLLECDGQDRQSAEQGSRVRFALERTPFYAEGGGQVGDRGTILGDGFEIRVDDTQKDESLYIHSGEVISGTATPSTVQAKVNQKVRGASASHHSATHLLHSALCQILGDHIEQQGSHVSDESLRFDYNHPQGLSKKEIVAIEAFVNDAIAQKHTVSTEEVSIADARARGAKAQFGEKYGETVRVVSMGAIPVSVELCGGCHVANTQDIQSFHIVKDEASSAGVRRISALAGALALQMQGQASSVADACATLLGCDQISAEELQDCAQLLKVQTAQVSERIGILVAEMNELAGNVSVEVVILTGSAVGRIRALQKDIKRLRQLAVDVAAQEAMTAIDGILAEHKEVAGLPVYIGAFTNVDAAALKQVADAMIERLDTYCIVIGSNNDGKAALLTAVSADVLAKGLKAGALVSALAKKVGGGGGGRPDFAQAGGKNGAEIPAALASVAQHIEAALVGTVA